MSETEWPFLLKFPPDGRPKPGSSQPTAEQFFNAAGAVDLLRAYGGESFAGGLYRLYNADEIAQWTAAVEEAFPRFKGRIRCFGRDWLCNQFALDSGRVAGNEPQVVLFEIDTGKALEIPASFAGFHKVTLIEQSDAALAEGLYHLWRETDDKPLLEGECVGYGVPLFMGGKDNVANLERTDADVYWTLTAQIFAQVKNLPAGSPIDGVSIKK